VATAEGGPPAYARLSAVAPAGGPPSAPTPLAVIDAIERDRIATGRGARRTFPLPVHITEFRGTKSPKSKWRFTKAGEDWFCFAGLWRPAAGDVPEAFTLLTTAPGPDVAPIHDRQMVVLERADWLAWLELSRPEAELLQPLPAGSLHVEQVR
jgi:hypothetical protein